jgi:Tfp pilus assembly protein PilX
MTHKLMPKYQQGAVLFIALIAMIAMMMGALALLRSVDSATGIAGNIGFRQQGVAVTDTAIEAATLWLAATPNLDNDVPGTGYYATQDAGITNNDILTFKWDQSGLKMSDQNGYQLWYVIHRLCSATGMPQGGTCSDSGERNVQASDTGETQGLAGKSSVTPMYRITARALGPRQSESIVQVITY